MLVYLLKSVHVYNLHTSDGHWYDFNISMCLIFELMKG